MANPYELGTSLQPPTPPPNPAAKIGVTILVIAAAAAGAWYYISTRDSGEATSETVADAAVAAPSPAPTTESPAPTPAATPTPSASPQPSVTPTPAVRRPRPAVSPTPTPTPTPTPAPSPTPPPPPPVQPVPQPAPERPAVVTRPPAFDPDAPVYDSATVDVKPPSLLTPIGIAPVRTNYVPGLATIEVIVGGDGMVQSARAGRPPVTVGETLEMMNWLSAAKSWRFAPAVKNGQSVKYLLIVPLSALVSGRGIR